MLRLRRPTPADLAAVLERARDEPLTYPEVGATAATLPAGYHHVRAERVLGNGDALFGRAVAALRDWAPQRGSGIAVRADGPLGVGTNVALAAPLPVGFAIATCRVVQVDDDEDRYAFAYGTLPEHPERGEEGSS